MCLFKNHRKSPCMSERDSVVLESEILDSVVLESHLKPKRVNGLPEMSFASIIFGNLTLP